MRELVTDHLDIWTAATERRGAGRGAAKRIGSYGVERLRALILDLAVRGKLVPQDERDEPATELLRRLRGRALTVEGLPYGWAAASLSALGSFVGGLTPSKAKPLFWGEGYPWVSPKDMGGDTVDQSEDQVTQAALDETGLQIVPPGSLLMVARSGILRRKFPVAITNVQCTLNQDLKALVLKPEVDGRYLQVMLQGFQPRILSDLVKRGMTVESLIFREFASASWPLPPLAEQRRIVAKVDELMALCDALEGLGAEALEAHQALVDTLLTALVDSHDDASLAGDWAQLESHFDALFTTEASVDALKRCVLELAVRGKLVPHERPDGWTTSELGKLIGPMDSGWSPACHEFPARTEETWGVLKTTAVQYLSYQPEQNKELPESLTPRPDAECRAGDVLITRAGPTNRVGICCFVQATRPRLMISDKIIRFRPKSDEIDGAYLALSLSVGPAANQIENAKSGMAASQVNISQAKLRAVIIATPPLSEQRRIVARVAELTALCDALKARISEADATARHLADAVVERAAA